MREYAFPLNWVDLWIRALGSTEIAEGTSSLVLMVLFSSDSLSNCIFIRTEFQPSPALFIDSILLVCVDK